mmetsp:Transcript_83401/g.235088  ORF Transcript_83401/g.235088 Transcript_83401/m.235088 type:complete len:219 (-) Transcript_83401:105-761(-)
MATWTALEMTSAKKLVGTRRMSTLCNHNRCRARRMSPCTHPPPTSRTCRRGCRRACPNIRRSALSTWKGTIRLCRRRRRRRRGRCHRRRRTRGSPHSHSPIRTRAGCIRSRSPAAASTDNCRPKVHHPQCREAKEYGYNTAPHASRSQPTRAAREPSDASERDPPPRARHHPCVRETLWYKYSHSMCSGSRPSVVVSLRCAGVQPRPRVQPTPSRWRQ